MIQSRAKTAALLIPGTDGHPAENWFPWLVDVLQGKGYDVDLPSLPVDPRHSLKNWFSAFDEQCGRPAPYRVCVAHSLGTTFALRLVESQRASFDLLISVAGCIGKVGIERFDVLNASFLSDPIPWAYLRQTIPMRVVLYSEDDPYISLAHSESLAMCLATPPISIGRAGHINAAAGYLSLPHLMPFLPDDGGQAC